MAHELRNLLQTAILSFDVLKSGRVGIAGSTGAVLGRSLIALSERVDTTLAQVRLAAGKLRRVQASVLVFVDEVAVAARLHADYRGLELTVEPVDPALRFDVDPQLLASALTNLLQNAFKYTRDHGRVTLRTRSEDGRVLIDVEDQCGGLAEGEAEPSSGSATDEGAIGPASGSGSPLPGRPSRRSGATSTRATFRARAASSPSTFPCFT